MQNIKTAMMQTAAFGMTRFSRNRNEKANAFIMHTVAPREKVEDYTINSVLEFQSEPDNASVVLLPL